MGRRSNQDIGPAAFSNARMNINKIAGRAGGGGTAAQRLPRPASQGQDYTVPAQAGARERVSRKVADTHAVRQCPKSQQWTAAAVMLLRLG